MKLLDKHFASYIKSRCKIALYECRCGKKTTAVQIDVKRGFKKSCGCHNNREFHGLTKSSEYNSRRAAKARCEDRKNNEYHRYGAKGIKMCKEWSQSFKSFVDYIGLKPESKERLTLDRIDSKGNYEPGNVRWATYKQQANNKKKG